MLYCSYDLHWALRFMNVAILVHGIKRAPTYFAYLVHLGTLYMHLHIYSYSLLSLRGSINL